MDVRLLLFGNRSSAQCGRVPYATRQAPAHAQNGSQTDQRMGTGRTGVRASRSRSGLSATRRILAPGSDKEPIHQSGYIGPLAPSWLGSRSTHGETRFLVGDMGRCRRARSDATLVCLWSRLPRARRQSLSEGTPNAEAQATGQAEHAEEADIRPVQAIAVDRSPTKLGN